MAIPFSSSPPRSFLGHPTPAPCLIRAHFLVSRSCPSRLHQHRCSLPSVIFLAISMHLSARTLQFDFDWSNYRTLHSARYLVVMAPWLFKLSNRQERQRSRNLNSFDFKFYHSALIDTVSQTHLISMGESKIQAFTPHVFTFTDIISLLLFSS